MSARFVHTHLHSEFSLVDSTIRIKALVAACVQAQMPAVALTDECNMFALVKFYKACSAAGIKPLCGSDLWISAPDDPRPWRLSLLCQHREGYLNLSRLVSRIWQEGQHGGRALCEAAWLTAASSDGLLALLGRESAVARIALAQGIDAALVKLRPLAQLFPDRLYLELTRCAREGEEAWNQAALALATELALPVVAGNDVRFLKREDFEAHEARVCIHQGRVLADPRRPRDYSDQQYLKSPAEMAALFADIPEALENSVELAKRCNLELQFGTYYLPDFPVPAGHDLASHIRELARQGLKERLAAAPLAAGHDRDDYDARLERELDVIVEMGFPGYFLIVADFINWSKQHGIPVGPGRGSGAGSLVAWALKITDLDPLQFDLLFERFLNPERVSMPDFDIDFCMDRRDEVIDYVARKYGRDHVSQIITYGSMAAKAVLRDSGRVLGMGYGAVDKIAKLIPPRPLDLTLSDALGRTEKSKKEKDRVVKEFCELYEQDLDEARPLIELALKLENLTRNAGKHAGGVVIAPRPLTEFAPLYCEAGGGGVVTQYDKNDVEDVGLVKFDFLGLRTLTIIDWAMKAINARRAQKRPHLPSGHLESRPSMASTLRAAEAVRDGSPVVSSLHAGEEETAQPAAAADAMGGEPIDIAHIPLDDAPTYELLKRAQTVAVFQLESSGMQRMLKDARPDRFGDIIALVALYRPGPMDLIPSFIARKHGREDVEYPDPRVEPILKETYGIMVYQEQVMQMAQIVGGYSLGGADLLRRAMGKKDAEKMAKERAKFRAGAAKDGLTGDKADTIFDLMEKFAGYGFNKSHAAAYALVSYQTAWLKTHYPAEFMAATISSDMDNTDKAVTFIEESKAIGLAVLPPDVNASEFMFVAVEPQVIRYGLGAIKGVGQGACESIVAERQRNGAYKDLADFCRRVDPSKLNRRVLEALILSGALDALAPNRASLMLQLPDAIKAAEQHLRDQQSGQNDMFGAAMGTAAPVLQIELPTAPDWPLEQKLQGERDTLGHYLSGHPTDPWREELAQLATCPLGEIAARYQPPKPRKNDGDDGNRFRRGPDTPWTVAGMVVAVRKRGDSDAFVRLEDGSGVIEVSFFGELYQQVAPLLVRDEILIVDGGLRIDDFSGGGFQLRARSATTLADACRRHARLLQVRVNGIGAGFAEQLRQTLANFRGGRAGVSLYGYHNASAQADLELGEEWRVDPVPDLLRAVRALPGVKAVRLRLVRGES